MIFNSLMENCRIVLNGESYSDDRENDTEADVFDRDNQRLPQRSLCTLKESKHALHYHCMYQIMEQHTFKNVNTCQNTNIYSYLETSGGQSSNPYLNVVHFSTPELIRHLWQLKTAVFLHWCLICAVPFNMDLTSQEMIFLRISS